jgi:competence protein ComGC
MAIGGLVMGYLSFVMIPVIGLLAAIAIPNFVKARVTVQSNACVNNMRAIDSAVQQWALEKGKAKTDAIDEAAVATYMNGGVIPQCPAGGSYIFAPTVDTKPPVTCPNETAGPPPLHKLFN